MIIHFRYIVHKSTINFVNRRNRWDRRSENKDNHRLPIGDRNGGRKRFPTIFHIFATFQGNDPLPSRTSPSSSSRKKEEKERGKEKKKEKKPPLKTRRRSFRGTGRRGTRVDGGRIIAQLHSPPPFPPFGSKTRSPPLPAPVAGEIRKVAWYIKPKGTS